mmetsp:Transcript_15380/g.33928  ORF Transcript_15380/g.33928 Transcript_15380/m.33928 type:complete len:246 (+) Transcript_15380:1379-2116(+)
MAGGLDGVDAVEGVVSEGLELHEVGLHGQGGSSKARSLVHRVAAHHLVLVECDASDVRIGELGDVAHGTADAAAAVEHLGALGYSESACKVVLVARDGSLERLARQLVCEVEALAPAPLVEGSRQLVVGVHERCVGFVSGVQLAVVQVVVLVDPVVHGDVALLLLRAEGRHDRQRAADGVGASQSVEKGQTCHDSHARDSHHDRLVLLVGLGETGVVRRHLADERADETHLFRPCLDATITNAEQ